MDQNCSGCKHHSVSRRPRVISEVYDTLVEFADDEETVYHCRSPQGPHSGAEVGVVPVCCPAFAPGTKGMGADLDAAMKRWQDRQDRQGQRPNKPSEE